MLEVDKNTLVNNILKALSVQGLDESALEIIRSKLFDASIRPVRVIWECVSEGGVSTETLQEKYGYNQPPRAARDVRELGIGLKTKTGRTKDGRRMAIYMLDVDAIREAKTARKIFSKKEKDSLVALHGTKCGVCQGNFETTALQIDHRVPFEIAGNEEHETKGEDALWLLCASCNRSKSWSCEHCSNFEKKDLRDCLDCYWANPDNNNHVAGKRVVKIDLLLENTTHPNFEKLTKLSREELNRIIFDYLATY